MNRYKTLKAEIHKHLDELARQSRPWRAEWIAQEICNDHASGLADGVDADFWRYCGYRQCRELVRRCIGKRAGDRAEAAEEQSVFPGYEHPQSYYVVTRDGDDIGLPVEALSDEELASKALALRTMGSACYAHADEIERYARVRREAA